MDWRVTRVRSYKRPTPADRRGIAVQCQAFLLAVEKQRAPNQWSSGIQPRSQADSSHTRLEQRRMRQSRVDDGYLIGSRVPLDPRTTVTTCRCSCRSRLILDSQNVSYISRY